MTTETTRHTSNGMHTRLVATAADVISRAMQQGRTLPAALAVALDSACLLQSPDNAAELDRLRRQSATGASTPASEEHTKVTELIGDAKPAADSLLVRLAESVRDRREHEHPTWEDLYCLNLVSWMGERMGPVLRRVVDAEARVAELEADREANDREYEQATARVAELDARLAEYERPADEDPIAYALTEQAATAYPTTLPWARLMDDDDLEEFLADLTAAIVGRDGTAALDEVEKTCGTWRLIAEAQHAHNTAPGPDAQDEPAAAPLIVYRASHDSIPMGLYTTAAEARKHCETELRREWPNSLLDWIEDEEDAVAELVAENADGETPTGYVVEALEVATEYDAEADQ